MPNNPRATKASAMGCRPCLPPSAQDAPAASVDSFEANAEIVLPTRTDEDGETIPTTPAQVIDQMANGFLDQLLEQVGHEPFIDV